MQVFRVIPFIKLQNNTQQLNSEKQWKMRRRAKPLTCFWLSYAFMSSAWTDLHRLINYKSMQMVNSIILLFKILLFLFTELFSLKYLMSVSTRNIDFTYAYQHNAYDAQHFCLFLFRWKP